MFFETHAPPSISTAELAAQSAGENRLTAIARKNDRHKPCSSQPNRRLPGVIAKHKPPAGAEALQRGGALESRATRVGVNWTNSPPSSGALANCSNRSAATLPISRIGRRTEVNVGQTWDAIGASS